MLKTSVFQVKIDQEEVGETRLLFLRKPPTSTVISAPRLLGTPE